MLRRSGVSEVASGPPLATAAESGALDLAICARGKLGSAAAATPTPAFGVSGLQAARVGPTRPRAGAGGAESRRERQVPRAASTLGA